jgi:hypothetical protein
MAVVHEDVAAIAIAALLEGTVEGGAAEIARILLETMPAVEGRERIAAEIAVMVWDERQD